MQVSQVAEPDAGALDVLGVAVVVVVTVLSLAPILSARMRSRAPSVVATFVLGLLILSFTVGLAPWVPAASSVLAAAIAGPPGKIEGLPQQEPLENNARA